MLSGIKYLMSISICALFMLSSCSVKENFDSKFILHPDDPNKKIEYFIKYPKGTGPFPAILFIHGHQEGLRPGGKDFVDWGVLNQFANRGLIAISASQPGYGNSDGPSDYCGPFTTDAIIAVINKIKEDKYFSDTLILEGISRGAIVAGLVSTKEPLVKAAILISGLYDLNEYAGKPNPSLTQKSIIQSMYNEIGNDTEGMKKRSLLNYTKLITASLLIINGEKDDRTDPNQARKLNIAINQEAGKSELIIYPEYGHQIPVEIRNKVIDPFIDKIIKR